MRLIVIILIMYISHVLINALNAHSIHINQEKFAVISGADATTPVRVREHCSPSGESDYSLFTRCIHSYTCLQVDPLSLICQPDNLRTLSPTYIIIIIIIIIIGGPYADRSTSLAALPTRANSSSMSW